VLAERSGVDAQRIWEWGFLERVSTGLYVMDVMGGPESVARPYLESAEKLVD
jgi:streptomycin 6-kinase